MIKKLLLALAIVSAMVACEKAYLIPEPESEQVQMLKAKKDKDKNKKVKTFTRSVDVEAKDGSSSPTTRIYDGNLVWHWEYGDALLGYQVAVDNIRNRLEYNVQTGLFSCTDFTYQSNQHTPFHFVYPHAAEFQRGKLRPLQDGNWRPVCVTTTEPAKVTSLPTLSFEQLSSALELRIWNQNNTAMQDRIISIEMTSESDFVPVWVLDEETMTYEQTLSGKKIAIDGLKTSVVQINMPDLPEGYPDGTEIKVVLTREDGKTMTTTLPSDLVFVKQMRTVYNLVFVPDPTFTCVTYNVDGLPRYDSTVHGQKKQHAKTISSKIAASGWDIIGFQENYEYNVELTQSMKNYQLGNFRGTIVSPAFTTYTDGIGFATLSSTSSHQDERYISYNETYGDYYDGVNTCIARGFRYYMVTLKDGVAIDVYVSQMNVGDTDQHRAARAFNYKQLAEYINDNRSRRPIVILGDFAGLYTSDDFENYFWSVLDADLYANLSDPWADTQWDGYYPYYGEPAYVPSDLYDPVLNADDYELGDQDGEVSDKILYINDPQSDVRIWAKNYKRDMSFIGLADRVPVVVEFGYEKVK